MSNYSESLIGSDAEDADDATTSTTKPKSIIMNGDDKAVDEVDEKAEELMRRIMVLII